MVQIITALGGPVLFLTSILQDDMINDFSTDDASPSKEFAFFTIELFTDHETITSIAFHNSLLCRGRFIPSKVYESHNYRRQKLQEG